MENTQIGLDKNGKSQKDLIEANEQNIPAWKEKHKTIKAISVHSQVHGTCHFIIGKPTRAVLDSMTQYEADGKTKKSQEVLFNSCLLAGDKTLLPSDVDLQTAVGNKIVELFQRLEVEEKEL